MKTYNSRKEVPEKYKWNLDDFYKNDKDFDKDYNEVVKSIPKLKCDSKVCDILPANVCHDKNNKDEKAKKLCSYDSSNNSTEGVKGYYVKVGQLTFSIFEKELEENGCDIKRGDYIGIQVTPEHMEFFVVTDDGRVNYDNRHTLWGTVPYYRSITCAVANDITETQNI